MYLFKGAHKILSSYLGASMGILQSRKKRGSEPAEELTFMMMFRVIFEQPNSSELHGQAPS